MYTLIRERVASMYELTYVYNLDEMLKLYDLIMMQRDIEYSRSQKERGGVSASGKRDGHRKVCKPDSVQS